MRLLRLVRLLRLPLSFAYNPAANPLLEFKTADGKYFLTANGRYIGVSS